MKLITKFILLICLGVWSCSVLGQYDIEFLLRNNLLHLIQLSHGTVIRMIFGGDRIGGVVDDNGGSMDDELYISWVIKGSDMGETHTTRGATALARHLLHLDALDVVYTVAYGNIIVEDDVTSFIREESGDVWHATNWGPNFAGNMIVYRKLPNVGDLVGGIKVYTIGGVNYIRSVSRIVAERTRQQLFRVEYQEGLDVRVNGVIGSREAYRMEEISSVFEQVDEESVLYDGWVRVFREVIRRVGGRMTADVLNLSGFTMDDEWIGIIVEIVTSNDGIMEVILANGVLLLARGEVDIADRVPEGRMCRVDITRDGCRDRKRIRNAINEMTQNPVPELNNVVERTNEGNMQEQILDTESESFELGESSTNATTSGNSAADDEWRSGSWWKGLALHVKGCSIH